MFESVSGTRRRNTLALGQPGYLVLLVSNASQDNGWDYDMMMYKNGAGVS